MNSDERKKSIDSWLYPLMDAKPISEINIEDVLKLSNNSEKVKQKIKEYDDKLDKLIREDNENLIERMRLKAVKYYPGIISTGIEDTDYEVIESKINEK